MEGFTNSIKQLFTKFMALIHPKNLVRIKITNLETPVWQRLLFFTGLGLVGIGLLLTLSFLADARSKFLPGTTLNQIEIGQLSPDEAATILAKQSPIPPESQLVLQSGDIKVASSSTELNAHYDYGKSLTDLLKAQQLNAYDWLRRLLFNDRSIPSAFSAVTYDDNLLRKMVEELKAQADQKPQPPSIALGYSGNASSITVDRGEDASVISTEATMEKVRGALAGVNTQSLAKESLITIEAVLTPVSQRLTDEQVEQARQRAQNLVGEQLVFESAAEHLIETLTDRDLVSLLTLPDGYNNDLIGQILTEWAEEINRAPQNADFVYNSDTLQVTSFVPDRTGLELDLPAMQQLIIEGLKELEGTDTVNLTEATINKELALKTAEPETTLADTNDLGINERIGFGESYYYHSIPTRIHNVALTTQKISLTLVPPGKEFSFNKTLGDVSAVTGFQPAYVIKDGQTILGDGGGVCQVSSTLFRTLLDAGLDITLRLPHSYRVSYYELDSDPGFDATVYAGNVDLRFINDTDHYILIYGKADSNNLHLVMEIYGTSDGRTTEISNYKTWDARPPLPTEYAPDPSLAPGQLKQIDWAASGIKAEFTHTVRDKDGKLMRQDTYYSNYRPWAAKFLQGV